MMNEFVSKTDKEIRRRGHFTIYDDGSVQSFLSEKLREPSPLTGSEKKEKEHGK